MVLDDLQWSDAATLDLLAALAEPLGELPALVIGAYRSDGLARDHMLRRLRNDLRRGGRLEELALEPLDGAETAELLAAALGSAPSPTLARTVHDRTQGIPFFVEELARALAVRGALRSGRRGLELAGDDVPVPDTVRDAVLMAASELTPEARAAAEAAAVAGEAFDLGLVAGITGEAALAELADADVLREAGPGRAAFRHALTREALYADVPWLRRRALHRGLAEGLSAAGGSSRELATHWLGAGEGGPARAALLRAAEESFGVHAYRDAARAGRQALELWPDGEAREHRIAALAAYAHAAELAGELAESARAWREVCALRDEDGARADLAEAQRRLAGVQELRGEREAAYAARQEAAEGFAAAGRPGEAAVERLAMANHHRFAGRHSASAELARAAAEDAAAAGRLDLRARALGLEGVALAKRGDSAAGIEAVRAGLALAVEGGLTAVAAELYQRLSLALYDGGDYGRAEETLDIALDLCRAGGETGTEVACVTCLVYVLRERGEWERTLELGRDLIAAGTAVWVVEGVIGGVHAFQGRLSAGRRLLSSALAVAARVGHYHMQVDTTAGLAWLAAAEGAHEEAEARCAAVLALWEATEDHHDALWGLRWAAAYLARRGRAAEAGACTEALARMAAETGRAETLAALAAAIGEAALAAGDADTAADQLGRALDVQRTLEVPFERAQIELRAGVALAAAGDREAALERLVEAYRTARRLGARPLAAEAAREVAALGESVVRRLGRRAAAQAEGGGLSRRELEVLRLVAVGRANREIADQLVLSPRTVDMHVRNILRKLECRSRQEAAHRAGQLGLLG
jgi:DNA-binding CsgD family transcriptional regulator